MKKVSLPAITNTTNVYNIFLQILKLENIHKKNTMLSKLYICIIIISVIILVILYLSKISVLFITCKLFDDTMQKQILQEEELPLSLANIWITVPTMPLMGVMTASSTMIPVVSQVII